MPEVTIKAAADRIANHKQYLVAQRVQKLSEILGIRRRDNSLDTEIGNIIRSIEEARDLRAPLANVSDKFARIFVPSAFAVAIGAFIVTASVPIAITVLIMASPCAVLL